jgi:putative resolvase
MHGGWRTVQRLPADRRVVMVVVVRRDRWGPVDTELVAAALWAHGRWLVVLDCGEVTDDLVCDMVEVLTWLCARRDGRGWAPSRAIKAAGCALRNIGPKLVGVTRVVPPKSWRVSYAASGLVLDSLIS